jgi:prepilin-type N-terminal cleavage/methylation domain-containing protein
VKNDGLGEKGFTLIEMLVVVGLLAALAGVVVINIMLFINRGHEEAAATEFHNIQCAVVAYMSENDRQIPSDVDALVNARYLLIRPHGSYVIDQSTAKITQTSYP